MLCLIRSMTCPHALSFKVSNRIQPLQQASQVSARSNSTSQSVLEWIGSCSVSATTTANRSAGR